MQQDAEHRAGQERGQVVDIAVGLELIGNRRPPGQQEPRHPRQAQQEPRLGDRPGRTDSGGPAQLLRDRPAADRHIAGLVRVRDMQARQGYVAGNGQAGDAVPKHDGASSARRARAPRAAAGLWDKGWRRPEAQAAFCRSEPLLRMGGKRAGAHRLHGPVDALRRLYNPPASAAARSASCQSRSGRIERRTGLHPGEVFRDPESQALPTIFGVVVWNRARTSGSAVLELGGIDVRQGGAGQVSRRAVLEVEILGNCERQFDDALVVEGLRERQPVRAGQKAADRRRRVLDALEASRRLCSRTSAPLAAALRGLPEPPPGRALPSQRRPTPDGPRPTTRQWRCGSGCARRETSGGEQGALSTSPPQAAPQRLVPSSPLGAELDAKRCASGLRTASAPSARSARGLSGESPPNPAQQEPGALAAAVRFGTSRRWRRRWARRTVGRPG